MIQAGQPAPEDVTVFTRPEVPATLRELRGDGPAVLLFYPLAFSGVCTREICSIADDFSPWANLGVSVIALSVDSPYVAVKFAESTNATFPIVSDFNGEAMRAFDVERDDIEGLKGVSERAVFVIDRAGMIRYTWIGEHPGVFPPMEEIRAAVQKLQ